MVKSIINLTDDLYKYIFSTSVREPEPLKRLREETINDPLANFQISPDQGQFMALLVKLIGAKKTIDIGTFTGYSSLIVALAMPDDSITITCDLSRTWTNIAKKYWKEAGVDHKIDLRLAPALHTLDNLINDGYSSNYDFIFIDADKENYDSYYERALTLLRPGGLVAIDNVLLLGAVADPENQDAETMRMRNFNKNLKDDNRVDISLLTIADGLTLALKR